MKYKTFADLNFLQHGLWNDGLQARLDFDNGYGVSVITGDHAYSDEEHPYEVACMKNGYCCYPINSSFQDDVVGYCTEEQVNRLMREIQDLPSCKNEYQKTY